MKKQINKSSVLIGLILISIFILSCLNICQYLLKSNKEVINDNINCAIEIVGSAVENFHMVSQDLYRGAQPSQEALNDLQNIGIETIINLRLIHNDDVVGMNMNYIEIPMIAIDINDKDVIKFLQIVSKTENGPFFVHCQHGSDRTGVMCAMYRIVIQGWTKEEAIRELAECGYGYHEIFDNIIKYIDNVDIEKIKEKL